MCVSFCDVKGLVVEGRAGGVAGLAGVVVVVVVVEEEEEDVRALSLYLENFVHSKVDSLNDISTIVEDSTDILRVDCAGEVGITVMCVMLFAVGLTTLLRNLKEIIPDEVLGPRELPVRPLVYLLLGFRRYHVVHKLREVFFQL